MKAVFVCLLVLVNGCSAFAWKDANSPEQLAKIKNYTLCSADYSCPKGMSCGFVVVDTYAVCR